MKTTTLKIRIQGMNPEEVEKATKLIAPLFPTLLFGKPREGTNPKYEGRQQFASYTSYRKENKKPVPVEL